MSKKIQKGTVTGVWYGKHKRAVASQTLQLKAIVTTLSHLIYRRSGRKNKLVQANVLYLKRHLQFSQCLTCERVNGCPQICIHLVFKRFEKCVYARAFDFWADGFSRLLIGLLLLGFQLFLFLFLFFLLFFFLRRRFLSILLFFLLLSLFSFYSLCFLLSDPVFLSVNRCWISTSRLKFRRIQTDEWIPCCKIKVGASFSCFLLDKIGHL